MSAIVTPGRWVMSGGHLGLSANQCKFCGRFQSHDCTPATCMLCGTVQCHANGGSDGCCKVCGYGYLPGWFRSAEEQCCGRKGCGANAVTRAPRVGRVCAEHAKTAKVRVGARSLTLAEYSAEQVAHRDSGKGWERWRFVGAK